LNKKKPLIRDFRKTTLEPKELEIAIGQTIIIFMIKTNTKPFRMISNIKPTIVKLT